MRYVFYKKNKKIVLDQTLYRAMILYIKFRENIYVLLIKLKNTSGKKHAFMK